MEYMRKPSKLPPELARLPFTVEQARGASVPKARMQASDLWTPSRSIRAHKGAVFDLVESCRPYTQVTASGAISHITAARIHGLFLPPRCENEGVLHLSRPKGVAEPKRKHVVGHRLLLPPADVADIQGVPVTTLQRTLLDIAPLLTLDELVVIGDQLVCEHCWDYRPPQLAKVPLDALNAYLCDHPGSRAIKKLRAAMELVRIGADSPPETRLRLMISRSPLPNFEPNMVLRNLAGKEKVHPDLGCEEYRTCIEYDGDHHTTAEQLSKDHDRNFITESLGWHQVLINKDDLRMGEHVVISKIARKLVQGGWPDPEKLAERSLLGSLGTRKDFG